ncbi:Ppx/GppA family phosphatase [Streptomyces sp. G45]|uniref:Ppx/GppA phosphatase family protein n=1 Tax=Streptomyces sp. G45 TaxID=3406627 RepID=UPI003C1A08F1
MRMSVVDVGSNTVRLVIADAADGVPLPVHTVKWKLRLSEHAAPGGPVPEQAVRHLADAVADAAAVAGRRGAGPPLAFATAVVRDAPNRREVLRAVRARSGVRLCALPGEAEAELTFLGARRWLGWQAGALVLFDIGGGSLEVAFGHGRLPDFAASLPLGANRLTHEWLGDADPPSADAVRALRRAVRRELRDVAARVRREAPHTAVVTSRTFQRLARLSGAAPGHHGPFVRRELTRAGVRDAVGRLAALPAAERARLPGVSAPRAAQSLAGAVVGHTALKLTGVRSAVVCPWAVREGVLLRHLEDGGAWWERLARDADDAPAPPCALR